MAENTEAALDNNDITLTPTTPKKKKKSQNECLPTRPALDNTNKHVARQQWGVNAKLEIVNKKKSLVLLRARVAITQNPIHPASLSQYAGILSASLPVRHYHAPHFNCTERSIRDTSLITASVDIH